MKISIVIESSDDFDADQLMDWLNDEFSMGSMGTGGDLSAISYTIIEE